MDAMANKRYDHYYEAQEENIIDEKNEQKTDWMKRISSPNQKTEQEKLVEKMKKVLNFLEHVQIKDEDSLVHISKPLDDLLSSLKYIPTEPFFNNLPTEIKTDILSYLCDSGAFIASTVNPEWRDLIEKRLVKLEKVNIGKCCKNKYCCENSACFMPEEMLKASINLKLDIPLVMCCPVPNVDSELLTEGLMSVSELTITDDCDCMKGDTEDMPTLTKDQTRALFEGLEKKSDMDTVRLKGLDMTHLDQDRLINCLLFKVKKLFLNKNMVWVVDRPLLDFDMMIEKFLEVPTKFTLSHLGLEYMGWNEVDEVDLANALCRVKSVNLGVMFDSRRGTLERLVQNILHPFSMEWNGKVWHGQCSRIQTLSIHIDIDWRDLITPEDLKNLISKINGLDVCGRFTPEQVQAAKSTPGVQVIEPPNETYMIISKNISVDVSVFHG